MTQAQFLLELQDVLQREEPITPDTFLWDMEEWDSLAIMACMAWFDKDFGIQTKFSQYKDLGMVTELSALVGGALQD